MSGRLSGDDRGSAWLLIIGIALVSLNLRPAIVSVSPLLDAIRTSLELSNAEVSFLTAVPVFLIGAFALAAPPIVRRLGSESGVFWGVVLIGVGTAARLWGGYLSVLIVTTVLVGVGIGIVQALLPAMVKVYFPERAAFATGLYTVSLTVGATAASGATVPLERLLGSWPGALAIWALVALVALVAWLPVQRGRSRDSTRTMQSSTPSTDGSWSLWRDPLTWLLTLFYAFNTSIYYSILTWLPPRYTALGWSEAAAGLVLTVFIVASLVGMLLIMAFGDRVADRRVWLVPLLSLALVGAVGTALSPETAPWLWAATFGLGLGAWFTLMLMLPVDYAADSDATSELSAIALAGGYMIGAVAPFSVGALRDIYGGFTGAFVGLAALVALGLLASFLLGPERSVTRP
ncbi:CynX/NimT family MFS transporter [Natrialbaceae archaeon A-arb3/5]